MRNFRRLLTLGLTFMIGSTWGDVLEQWHWRSPLPQGNAIYGVVSANGTLVAVGEMGTILTSNDGTNWTPRASGTQMDLRDCAFGAGHYVVVGDYGTVLASIDLQTWTPQFAGTFYSLRGITFANGQFVCVGEQASILTSGNGVDWSMQASGPWQLEDVTYAEGLFVAAGGIGTEINQQHIRVLLTSTNAQSWAIRVLTYGPPFRSLTYGDGQFAVTTSPDPWNGFSSLWSSTNGLDWQPLPPVAMSAYQSRLTYGDGLWVLVNGVADYPVNPGDILCSADLLNWTTAYTNSQSLSAVTFAGDKFVAAGYNGVLLTSADGTNWANPVAGIPDLFFLQLTFLNGRFVGVNPEQFFFSSNGVNWATAPAPTNTGRLVSLAFGHGLYVAGGEYRSVWISTNGAEWSTPETNLSLYPYGGNTHVAFGNGVFVGASGSQADILTSPDGLNWMTQTLVTNDGDSVYFNDLTFANGRFVAVANTAIATSLDGTNWHLLRTNLGLYSVAGGAGHFAAVGGNILASSNDGTNWVSQFSNDPGSISDVAFGAGWFVATTTTDYSSPPPIKQPRPYWISPDGFNWIRRTASTPQDMWPVAFGDGTFIAGTEHGGLLQTDPLITLALRPGSPTELGISGPRYRQYQVQYRDEITTTNDWALLGTLVVTNEPGWIQDPTATNAPRRFYRAALLPGPVAN